MTLICRGYNTCSDKDSCMHSKPHQKIRHLCDTIPNDPPSCNCIDLKILRKDKLEKINESNLQIL